METTDKRRGKEAIRADEDVVAASEVRRLEERVGNLERLLGRKTMEAEILKKALDLARVKRPTLLSRAASGRYSVKRIAETLGVDRSKPAGASGPRASKTHSQTRAGDRELTSDIQRLVNAIPADRRDPVNAKGVYRLMKKSGLFLGPHTGSRIPRTHGGTIVTCRANERWCFGALEFTRWNGEIVRGCLRPRQP